MFHEAISFLRMTYFEIKFFYKYVEVNNFHVCQHSQLESVIQKKAHSLCWLFSQQFGMCFTLASNLTYDVPAVLDQTAYLKCIHGTFCSTDYWSLAPSFAWSSGALLMPFQ